MGCRQIKKKGKAVPLQAWSGPEEFQKVKVPSNTMYKIMCIFTYTYIVSALQAGHHQGVHRTIKQTTQQEFGGGGETRSRLT